MKKANTVTQKMIAEHIGVSVSTVNHVLKGREHVAKLSAETVARVRNAIDELDYRFNHAACSLKSGRSFTLGMLSFMYGVVFWERFATEVQRVADTCNYNVLRITDSGNKSCWERALDYANERRLEGLVITGDTLISKHFPDFDFPVPIIAVSPIKTTAVPIPAVIINEEAGIGKATKHLLDLGHQNLLWIGVKSNPASRRREEAFARVCDEARVEHRSIAISSPEINLTLAEAQIEFFYRQLAEIFPHENAPSGIVCWNDDIALALCFLLQNRGLRVPEDVSVTGFDDISACYCMPALTTVKHMFHEMSSKAVKTLIAGIENGSFPREGNKSGELTVVEPDLLIRGSTGPAGSSKN